MFPYFTEVTAGGALAAAVAAAWRFLRSESGRKLLAGLKLSTVRQSCEEVRAALETLSLVVQAQGESLEWLRQQLEQARKELADEKSRLEADNAKLRKRVAELEAQVKTLESLLAKRTRNVKRNTTTKRGK